MNYFFKRIFSTFLVLFGVLGLTFILMYIVPGDPIQNFVGQRADIETINNLKKEWGLDQSLPNQFAKYIFRIMNGDLGKSYFTQESILKSLAERFPITFILACLAILIGALIGIPIGILSAAHPNTFWDKGMLSLTLLGISLPVFWIGVLVLMASTKLDSLPFINHLPPLSFNIILASFVLGIRPAALLARITRTQISEILKEDFILSAWSRGLSKGRILLCHALRNAWPPILTTLAMDFGSLLSGAAITETIFGIPGIGKFALSGLGRRDYPAIMGMVLFSAFIFVFVNLVVDLVIPLLNPRLRLEKPSK